MTRFRIPISPRLLGVCSFLTAGLGSAFAQTTYTSPPYTVAGFVASNNSPLNNPQGVAVDALGNVIVADTLNEVIRAISPAGVVGTLAGQSGIGGNNNGAGAVAAGTVALFSNPTGVAVDGSGHVYVADANNREIREISGQSVTIFAGTGALGHADGPGSSATFANPYGVAVDSSSNVYVADEGNDTIREITPAGVVSTIAGTATIIGHSDGVGAAASFDHPEGVAVDSAGNVYVADSGNSTIRKITPSGSGASTTWTVSTLAGTAYAQSNSSPPLSADGTGSAARFAGPTGLTVDSGGNVYVADTINETIRRITPTGVVTTMAGQVGVQGSQLGAGETAEFTNPAGVAFSSTAGGVYIADTYNNAIDLATSSAPIITTQPQSQTVGTGADVTFTVAATSSNSLSYQWYLNGSAISGATSTSYSISYAQTGNTGPSNVYTVVVTADGTSVTSNSVTITILNISVPTITTPANQTVNAGSTVVFSATATGGDITYQWYFNGVNIANTNSDTLTLPNVGTSQAGNYTVSASNPDGSTISFPATLTVNYSARLDALSTRAVVGTGGNILIAGFGTGGTGSKNLLLCGVGPGLATALDLSNPQLTLYDTTSSPLPIVTNIGWGNAFTLGNSSVHVSPQLATSTFINSLGAYPLTAGSADSALEVTAPIGNYTAQISGVSGTSGVALAEIYDADTGTPTARLTAISSRAFVGVGGNILIGGFHISGSTSETVLICGVGPGLNTSNVANVFLAQPQLVLFDSSGNIIASNSGWSTAPTTGSSTVQAGVQPATAALISSVGAYPLASLSADSAMVVSLPPGGYTAQVSGIGTATGIALVEIYEVP